MSEAGDHLRFAAKEMRAASIQRKKETADLKTQISTLKREQKQIETHVSLMEKELHENRQHLDVLQQQIRDSENALRLVADESTKLEAQARETEAQATVADRV